jgi:hypothetical protein
MSRTSALSFQRNLMITFWSSSIANVLFTDCKMQDGKIIFQKSNRWIRFDLFKCPNSAHSRDTLTSKANSIAQRGRLGQILMYQTIEWPKWSEKLRADFRHVAAVFYISIADRTESKEWRPSSIQYVLEPVEWQWLATVPESFLISTCIENVIPFPSRLVQNHSPDTVAMFLGDGSLLFSHWLIANSWRSGCWGYSSN